MNYPNMVIFYYTGLLWGLIKIIVFICSFSIQIKSPPTLLIYYSHYNTTVDKIGQINNLTS